MRYLIVGEVVALLFLLKPRRLLETNMNMYLLCTALIIAWPAAVGCFLFGFVEEIYKGFR